MRKLVLQEWVSLDGYAAVKLNGIPKVVFSNTLKEAPWGKWPGAKVVPGDAVRETEKMKAGKGKDLVVWGSLSLAQSLIKANLIDEYHIYVCPTMVGGGKPLFPELEGYSKLKLVDFKKYDSGVMLLHYEPAFV